MSSISPGSQVSFRSLYPSPPSGIFPATALNSSSSSPGNIPSTLTTSITSAPSQVAAVKKSSTPMIVVLMIVFAAFLLFDNA